MPILLFLECKVAPRSGSIWGCRPPIGRVCVKCCFSFSVVSVRMAYGYKRKRRYSRRRYGRGYRRRGYRSRGPSRFAPRSSSGRVPRSLAVLAERFRSDPGLLASVMAATGRRPDKSSKYVLPSAAKIKKAYQMAKLFYDAGMDVYDRNGVDLSSSPQSRFAVAAASHLWDNRERILNAHNRFSDWWQGALDSGFTDAADSLVF